MVINKIFGSKFLVFSLILSFLFLIATEATPNIMDSDSNKEFKPVVRVKEGREGIPAAQKDRFDRLIEEGKKLFQEEMDYEGAIKKFKEARVLAITRGQKADVSFHLSLAYYATKEEKGTEEVVETIRELIELDYYRELDELLCPPRYIELFQGIKKEYGALKVQSKPAGADVYINNSKVPVGKTPLTIGSKAGSVKIEDILKVVAGKETTSSIYILKGASALLYVLGGIIAAGTAGAVLLLKGKAGEAPGPTTGSIQVNSTPTGARIYLNGTDTGNTTNTTLTDVSPGNHTIKLVKEGYEDYEESISVTAGQTTTVNANLTIITITVTNPTSSTIWTKGNEVEIRWGTSGSSSFKAHVSTSTESNPLLHPGGNLLPSFRKRALQHRRSFRNLIRTRRELNNLGSSKASEINSNRSSKFQDVLKNSSSHVKEGNTYQQRPKNIGSIKKNKSFEKINLPVSLGISPQMFEPSRNIRVLALTNVKIELYKRDSQVKTIAPSTDNDGTHNWEIPTDLEDASDYKVMISCASDSEIYGESEEFRIEEKSIIVTEPTISTVWTKGYSTNITWGSKGTINNVKIDLYKGTTPEATIVSSTENDGSYTWTVDPSLADGSDYKVKISSASDSEVYGESDKFAIEEKSITVSEPTTSTIWTRGNSADITWISEGAISNVRIELYKGIILKQTIVLSTENDGIFTWTEVDLSLEDGSDYKVRISWVSDSGVYGESSTFKIE